MWNRPKRETLLLRNCVHFDASVLHIKAYGGRFNSRANSMSSPAKCSARTTAIRLLLIDDHPMLLDSLSYYLAQYPQLEIVGKLNHGDQCSGCVEKYRPEVVVMDLSMPGLGVFERLHELVNPVHQDGAPAVLILTSDLGEYRLGELIDAGARGYLSKGGDGKQLVAAILALAEGSMYLHSDFRMPPTRAAAPVRKADLDRQNHLSEREQQLLKLMAQGFSNKEIASRLFLSTGTVKSYSSRIFEKLNVHGRTQAVLHALNMGLVPAQTQRA